MTWTLPLPPPPPKTLTRWQLLLESRLARYPYGRPQQVTFARLYFTEDQPDLPSLRLASHLRTSTPRETTPPPSFKNIRARSRRGCRPGFARKRGGRSGRSRG